MYIFEIETICKILLASVFGGLIGLERELKGRPAGLKTFSLVCIGSALVMITNEYISIKLGYSGDSTRMAAQVISGIGFLGAGTIMITGQNQIKGLTTAAALWVTAALGIAVGTGFYFGSVFGVITIYVTSSIYRFIDRKIVENSKTMRFYIEGENERFLLQLLEYFRKQQIRVLSFQRRPENMWNSENACAMVEMEMVRRTKHAKVLKEILQTVEGIVYIEEL